MQALWVNCAKTIARQSCSNVDADAFSEQRTLRRGSTRYNDFFPLFLCRSLIDRGPRLRLGACKPTPILSVPFCCNSASFRFTLVWYLCHHHSLQFTNVLPTTVCRSLSLFSTILERFRSTELTFYRVRNEARDHWASQGFHGRIILPSYTSMQWAARVQEALYLTFRGRN